MGLISPGGENVLDFLEFDNCDIEWFALEMNRDHSVIFEIASKYCISDSFVDHDGYSISSKGRFWSTKKKKIHNVKFES